jgi:hypothetical protein
MNFCHGYARIITYLIVHLLIICGISVKSIGFYSPLGLLLCEVGPAHRPGFLPPKAIGAPIPSRRPPLRVPPLYIVIFCGLIKPSNSTAIPLH